MVPIAVRAPSLREFMKMVISLSNQERQSSNIVKTLCEISGQSKNAVCNYLDKLDFKYLRINWNGRQMPISIEVIKYDLDDLPDEVPVPARAAQGEIASCAKCNQTKKIFSKGFCTACYFQQREENAPVEECSVCKAVKKIYIRKAKICADCYKDIRAQHEVAAPEYPPASPLPPYNPNQELEDIKQLMSQIISKIEKLEKHFGQNDRQL